LTRSSSALVGPGRWPVSRSSWRTQRRNISGVEPILAAIDVIAAHCDLYWLPASLTMRTARSMTSGEYLGCFFIAPFSQTMEPLQNPGQFRFQVPARSHLKPWPPVDRCEKASTSFAVSPCYISPLSLAPGTGHVERAAVFITRGALAEPRFLLM
jgi:hypothetical protein